MVTKAGLPSIKIVPGLALYGRSFEMADPDCKGPECRFTGKESGATKGSCTDTCVRPSYKINTSSSNNALQCRIHFEH